MVFEWFYRARDHYRFSPRELKELVITAILFGFILSFRKWGGETFDMRVGIISWTIAAVFVFMAMFWNISWQKIFAINDGFIAHYHWWFQGVLLGVFITFMTFGMVPFLYPGNVFFEHSKKLRLGRFRHGENIKDFAVASIAGVVSNVVFALLLSFIYIPTQNQWVKLLIIINFLYAFFSMLPIPRIAGTKIESGATSGIYIFFFGRPLYVFIFASLIAYSGIIYLAASVWSSVILLIVSMILGAIVLFIFLKFIENTL